MQEKPITPDPGPPKQSGVHARTMLAAAESLGGLSNLAEFLKVPRADLFRWAIGDALPPQELFLVAVDLLLDDNRMLRASLKPPPSADLGAPPPTKP